MTAGLLAAGALALSLAGCGESVEPIERLGRKATGEVRDGGANGGPTAPSASGSASASASAPTKPSPSGAAGGTESHRRWGLSRPVELAPKPDRKAELPKAAPGRVPVVDRIPVPAGEKTVFLTFDDGAERDPEFLKMAADLRLPISMFLTDSVASAGYDHFAKLRDLGNGSVINNHTLSHLNLRTLSYEAQKAQICGQQDRLAARFGTRPRLFRPPYGNYNDNTLRAAKDCGTEALVLWRASMQIRNLQYAEGSALKPGDIILAHFRGPSELKGSTETEMTTRMLQKIQEQGFRIGRLEDYL
ncbi:polysaccharide deacetylase [Streptomyces venezuelae]|uniref:Polysaccharide deacetylase n=1 Tax=Streptomyces venezuelae TaxID=54571 RepID=A0A5P2DHR0_STRVZ|nr:polysaccharide deacetylase [Streptomyces venezuelae]